MSSHKTRGILRETRRRMEDSIFWSILTFLGLFSTAIISPEQMAPKEKWCFPKISHFLFMEIKWETMGIHLLGE